MNECPTCKSKNVIEYDKGVLTVYFENDCHQSEIKIEDIFNAVVRTNEGKKFLVELYHKEKLIEFNVR